MRTIPSWYTYCENTAEINALAFDLGNLTVFYSYKTPIAFQIGWGEFIISRNYWGLTTGKHLNAIDSNKKRRVSREVFKAALELALTCSD